MRREFLGLIVAAAMLVFGSATTFSSLGIVLFAMAREFHWSEAIAGGAFTVVILTCCISHLVPAVSIPRIGARWTIVGGGLIQAAGFLLAYTTRDWPSFYVAAGLIGIGFSLLANTPSVYLIAGWYGDRAPRMIGLYMMIGTLGGAIGPPVAGALVGSAMGWRAHWLVMTATALVLSAVCAVVIREPAARKTAGDPADSWSYRDIVRSPKFLVIALAMVATQIAVLTISSVTAPHFAKTGLTAALAASVLGMQGLVGTGATGISGWLTERFDPRLMLIFGLVMQALGAVLLAFAGSPWIAYAFAPVFGIGWSVTSLAVTVLLIRIFGSARGAAGLAAVWTLAGAAAVGPYAAGLIADRTGSFTPALGALALLMLPIALAAFMMAPSPRVAESPLRLGVTPDETAAIRGPAAVSQ